VSPQFTPIEAGAEHNWCPIYSFLLSVPLCWVEMLTFALINVDSRLTLTAAAQPPAGDSSSLSYLFSFRESVQDYKIHTDMEIVKFA
jgi:hypothetical protein